MRLGTGNTHLAKFGNESVNQWVSRFLTKLARSGYKPGFKWGRDFYFDFFDYLRVVAEVGGRSPVDLAVILAVKVLTLKDLPEDEATEDYSWIGDSLKPKSLEEVETHLLGTLRGPEPTKEEDYSWIDEVLNSI